MSRYNDKKELAFLTNVKEGINEAVSLDSIPEIPVVLPKVDSEIGKFDEKNEKVKITYKRRETIIEIDETKQSDPRYEGLWDVYFQDTEGKLALIPQAHQIKTIEEFAPIRGRKSPNSVSAVTYAMSNFSREYRSFIDNVFNGAHKDNPHRSESHPGHYHER